MITSTIWATNGDTTSPTVWITATNNGTASPTVPTGYYWASPTGTQATGWPIIQATADTFTHTVVGSACNVAVETVFVIDEEDYVTHAEVYELARQRGVAFRIRTAEERRRADEELARQRAAAEAARREREAADLRARELLFRYLTPEQRRTVEKNKWFVVVGGKSGTRYRIRTDYGVAGNIDVMRGETVEAKLCCHCSSDIPSCDQFLAQKIALQWDEESFLKTANRQAA